MSCSNRKLHVLSIVLALAAGTYCRYYYFEIKGVMPKSTVSVLDEVPHIQVLLPNFELPSINNFNVTTKTNITRTIDIVTTNTTNSNDSVAALSGNDIDNNENIDHDHEAGVLQLESIYVHPNASLRSDIISIEHHPRDASITVRIKQGSRCPRPFLRGRLSGPALVAMKDWRYFKDNKNNATEVVGTYVLPTTFAGHYFLELVVVYCENFLLAANNAGEHSNNYTYARVLPPSNNTYDFSQTCTENAEQRQLTSPNSIITVTKTITTSSSPSTTPGFWIHKHYNPSTATKMITTTDSATIGSDMNPLYTRYQLPGCFRKNTPECTTFITSAEPFQDYTFQWMHQIQKSTFSNDNDNAEQIKDTQQSDADFLLHPVLPSTPTNICVLGSSHARKLVDYLNMANITNNPNDRYPNITVQYHDRRMPFQVKSAPAGCDRLVISVGQWPPGKKFRVNRDGPFTVARFFNEYHQMAQRLLRDHDHNPNTVPVLFRSINYNPIGAMIGACPPTDWRSPAVIDGYNAAIQHVVMTMAQSTDKHVQFIDTDFLVGPMWDAASDWCHLDERIGLLQGLHVMQQALLLKS